MSQTSSLSLSRSTSLTGPVSFGFRMVFSRWEGVLRGSLSPRSSCLVPFHCGIITDQPETETHLGVVVTDRTLEGVTSIAPNSRGSPKELTGGGLGLDTEVGLGRWCCVVVLLVRSVYPAAWVTDLASFGSGERVRRGRSPPIPTWDLSYLPLLTCLSVVLFTRFFLDSPEEVTPSGVRFNKESEDPSSRLSRFYPG